MRCISTEDAGCHGLSNISFLLKYCVHDLPESRHLLAAQAVLRGTFIFGADKNGEYRPIERAIENRRIVKLGNLSPDIADRSILGFIAGL